MKVPPLGNYNSIKLSAAVPTNHLQLFLTSTYWFVLPDVDVPVFSDVDVPGHSRRGTWFFQMWMFLCPQVSLTKLM
jgi:hypothetical protein